MQKKKNTFRDKIISDLQAQVKHLKAIILEQRNTVNDKRILLDFNSRVESLARRNIKFIVVAEDEPYYIHVYQLIREQAIKRGKWTSEDESRFDTSVLKVSRRDVVIQILPRKFA